MYRKIERWKDSEKERESKRYQLFFLRPKKEEILNVNVVVANTILDYDYCSIGIYQCVACAPYYGRTFD